MTTFGGRFIEEATAPLRGAAERMKAGAVDEGLSSLRREALSTSLRGGVERVAKLAARPALDVFRMLPMTAIEDELAAYEGRHRAATAEWAARGEAAGAVEASDPAEALRALAGEDGPELLALAESVARWQERLAGCAAVVDGADELQQARAQRVFGRWAIAAALLGVGVGVGGLLWTRGSARARVDEVLARGDCAASEASESHRRYASAAQLDALAQAERRCADGKQAVAEAEAARKRTAEDKRASEEAAAAREEACGALAKAFESGDFEGVAPELLGGERARLERIVQGPLTVDDVEKDFVIPCEDTATGAAIRLALATRVLEIIPRWIQLVVPSAAVRRALVEHKAALPIGEISLVAGHIDVMAKRAVKTGLERDVAHFKVLCELSAALVQPPKSNCAAVLELARR